jgi:hypothetical protein
MKYRRYKNQLLYLKGHFNLEVQLMKNGTEEMGINKLGMKKQA